MQSYITTSQTFGKLAGKKNSKSCGGRSQNKASQFMASKWVELERPELNLPQESFFRRWLTILWFLFPEFSGTNDQDCAEVAISVS